MLLETNVELLLELGSVEELKVDELLVVSDAVLLNELESVELEGSDDVELADTDVELLLTLELV